MAKYFMLEYCILNTGGSKSWDLECFNQCCGFGSGIRCLFDPWTRDPGSGMGNKIKNQDTDLGSGSGMNILDYISESVETIFWVKSN